MGHRPASDAPTRLVARTDRVNARVERLGITRRPLRDVYHLLLRVSWPTLFGVFAASYLALNALFASLYAAQPGGIAGARPGSYVDAFFFSVQTLATIGYGVMSPQSLYTNVLVSLEALVGVLGFAIATGMMFAKFSRPTARVLFSEFAIVAPRDGVPCLMFRMANERDSSVVEATLNVVLTRSETTREGETFRRFHDLPLLRQRSPVFLLTWTAIHRIDAQSPLHGCSKKELEAQLAEVVVTFVGLDDLTLQQVHARHSYMPNEILFDHRFADILTVQADGRRTVDYRHFHRTHPLER